MNASTASATTKAPSDPHPRVKLPWSALGCLVMGLALIVHGVLLIFTVYLAVVGIFFVALGMLLCVGALESLAPEEEAPTEEIEHR